MPNAVFERLLEAVAAGQSAELMEQLNLLVNAGHSPSSLARQMVRYLRNTLMAKLGGAETELLQISGDERARAARTALLFTEEELTRNLQIVLRTFDDLNYRQEQRFHLELGLLKLIHAQRLLPLEELLSGVAARGGLRSAAPASAPAQPQAPRARSPHLRLPQRRRSRLLARQAAVGVPDRRWSRTRSRARLLRLSPQWSFLHPLPRHLLLAPFNPPHPFRPRPLNPRASPLEKRSPRARSKAPQAAVSPTSLPGIESIRHAVGCALVEAGHVSAAQLLGAGAWAIDGSSLRIEVTGVGKKMLALTINAAAAELATVPNPKRAMRRGRGMRDSPAANSFGWVESFNSNTAISS